MNVLNYITVGRDQSVASTASLANSSKDTARQSVLEELMGAQASDIKILFLDQSMKGTAVEVFMSDLKEIQKQSN
jgi:hypothetical protein